MARIDYTKQFRRNLLREDIKNKEKCVQFAMFFPPSMIKEALKRKLFYIENGLVYDGGRKVIDTITNDYAREEDYKDA
jgi:hypothetical protein